MKTPADSKTESAFSPTELAERTIHRRAIEAVIWGMPAVNAELLFQAMADAKPTSIRSPIGRGP
jgi:hypothetical protein